MVLASGSVSVELVELSASSAIGSATSAASAVELPFLASSSVGSGVVSGPFLGITTLGFGGGTNAGFSFSAFCLMVHL